MEWFLRLEKDVPDPKIEDANRVSLRITAANIRGFDPHMYDARTDLEWDAITARTV